MGYVSQTVSLTKEEREALNQIIADTTSTALKIGMSDEIIQEIMEIISTAFICGVVTARGEVHEPSLN